jgi:hypothetical protein
MSQRAKHDDDLEGLLAGLLGLIVVIGLTAVVYFLIAGSAPRDVDDLNWRKDPYSLGISGGFGLFLFLYGLVGVIRGRIVVGWGTLRQVHSTLTGAAAFVAACSTTLGSLLFLSIVAAYFVPGLGRVIHPLAALLSGLVFPALGWISGAILKSLGY